MIISLNAVKYDDVEKYICGVLGGESCWNVRERVPALQDVSCGTPFATPPLLTSPLQCNCMVLIFTLDVQNPRHLLGLQVGCAPTGA